MQCFPKTRTIEENVLRIKTKIQSIFVQCRAMGALSVSDPGFGD